MSDKEKINRPTHRVFYIKNPQSDRGKRWLEIGACWTNKDDSLTVLLDRMPYQGFPESDECALLLKPIEERST